MVSDYWAVLRRQIHGFTSIWFTAGHTVTPGAAMSSSKSSTHLYNKRTAIERGGERLSGWSGKQLDEAFSGNVKTETSRC